MHEIHAGAIRLFARPLGRIAVLAVAAAIATGIAVPAAGAGMWFTPPTGWDAARHPPQVLGVWVHPGDTAFRQNMVAGAERTTGSATQWDEAAIPKLRATLHNFVLGADAVTTSCGRPAHYMSYASVENGHRIIYEHMTTVVSGVAFFVIYARLSSQPSLPEARDALTTLCGAQIRHVAPGQPSGVPAKVPPTPSQAPTPPPTPEPGVSQGPY